MAQELKRRLSIYVPRLGRMLLNKQLSHPCWFMHIPKSGGSSIHEALRSLIPLNEHIHVVAANSTRRAAAIYFANADDENLVHEDGSRCDELFGMREQMLLNSMAHNDALIYGHILFSEKAHKYFGDKYKYVTVLRDPVSRVISNYRSTTYENYYNGTFDEYLESDVARRHAQLNLRYFSGIAEIEHGKEDSALQVAMINQQLFSVIGFLDDLQGFCSRFEEAFGSRLSIPHYNSAKGSDVNVTPDQIKRIKELCAFDIELYQRAKINKY